MSLLDITILLVIISWLCGFPVDVGGGLIQLLLAIALIMFIFRLARARRFRPAAAISA